MGECMGRKVTGAVSMWGGSAVDEDESKSLRSRPERRLRRVELVLSDECRETGETPDAEPVSPSEIDDAIEMDDSGRGFVPPCISACVGDVASRRARRSVSSKEYVLLKASCGLRGRCPDRDDCSTPLRSEGTGCAPKSYEENEPSEVTLESRRRVQLVHDSPPSSLLCSAGEEDRGDMIDDCRSDDKAGDRK
jgi:hypothetical protein